MFFRPALLESWRTYNRGSFIRDLGAGITVGVVALPLSMAFAMASGLKPEAGLFTAIVAGFLISALGGCRLQIGGPAGAYIVIVYGIVERYGVQNLVIATALSGLMLFAMGFLKLGNLIRLIPVAVVIGFTNGIAVLIALSQIKDFLGLDIQSVPADFFGMAATLLASIHGFNGQALALGCASLGLIVVWQVIMSRRTGNKKYLGDLSVIPGSVVALLAGTLAVSLLHLQVDTIGSRFGGISSELPTFAWPTFTWETARFLLVPASTLALLGAIESLLCARVADGMTGDRHNPNQELMAQGIANVVTPFFGGMPATGTIARTVVNINSGATSPVAGMVHSVTLVGVILIAAPLASNVPLATLAAILLFVAWNMGEWREFAQLRHFRMPYRITLLSVFFLTVVFDLTIAVQVGLLAACVTFIYRISSLTRAELISELDAPALAGQSDDIKVYRLYGALFFGSVKHIEALATSLPARTLILDLKNVIYTDSSGADSLMTLIKSCERQNVKLIVCGLNPQAQDMAQRSGLMSLIQHDCVQPNLAHGIGQALRWSETMNAGSQAVTQPPVKYRKEDRP
jgi:sulfate permease, SulP family